MTRAKYRVRTAAKRFAPAKGCGKNKGIVIPEKAAPVNRTTLRICWHCAGGLSAVNVIGTQLRDLITLGTDPMAVYGTNRWTSLRKSGEIPRESTRKNQPELGVENE